MNAFVIAVGSYVQPLTASALQFGEKIGPVMADLGSNQCQVPFARDYIRKVQQRGAIWEEAQEGKVLRTVQPCLTGRWLTSKVRAARLS